MFLVPGRFHSGEILEARGDADAARHHYEQVVERWADADPELQHYVTAARAALERLRQ